MYANTQQLLTKEKLSKLVFDLFGVVIGVNWSKSWCWCITDKKGCENITWLSIISVNHDDKQLVKFIIVPLMITIGWNKQGEDEQHSPKPNLKLFDLVSIEGKVINYFGSDSGQPRHAFYLLKKDNAPIVQWQ